MFLCYHFYSTGKSLGNIVDDGTGKIWLDEIECTGNEQALAYCINKGWGVGNCRHNEDVGIVCFNVVESKHWCFIFNIISKIENILFNKKTSHT